MTQNERKLEEILKEMDAISPPKNEVEREKLAQLNLHYAVINNTMLFANKQHYSRKVK